MQPPRQAERAALRRGVGSLGFFSLAFGSMIGVGWVTALGAWLTAAGPVGAIAAFLGGGLLMGLIGLCYAELTPMLPVAGGEVAYAWAAKGTRAAFVVGWFLAFGYLAVSAFEAISVGAVLGHLLPGLVRWPLYAVADAPVHATEAGLALVFTGLVTWVNFVGVRAAARVQVALTLAFALVAVVFVGTGLARGSLDAVAPAFTPDVGAGGALAGIAVVLVSAPFWFVGFDTIPQAAEEAQAALPPRRLGLLLMLSIAGAAGFYALLILSVAMTGPWQEIVDAELPTAAAFERALGSTALARLVLVAAWIGLLTSWNGFFLAGSRVLFALGRARILPAWFGRAHPQRGTPANAVLFSGAVTLAGALLGRGALGSVVNVGSFCIAVAFLGVSVSMRALRRSAPGLARPYRTPGGGLVPLGAGLGAGALLLVMLVPGSPAALRWPLEVLLLVGVTLVGAAAWGLGAAKRREVPEDERARLLLGPLAGPFQAASSSEPP